jgi:hypothetical protein
MVFVVGISCAAVVMFWFWFWFWFFGLILYQRVFPLV